MSMQPATAVTTGPTCLEMALAAPGMTLLHRAGLGGLASTLRALERDVRAGRVPGEALPGGPWGDKPPWEVRPGRIVLHFGTAGGAREYLRRLFAYAFGLRDGLLFLPGQYWEDPPPLEVRAELQAGVLLTFLQHGRTRTVETRPTTSQYDPGEGGAAVTVSFRRCTAYKHQEGWQDLAGPGGELDPSPKEVIGPLSPGAVVRHNAFAAPTKINEPPDRLLPLYFALVGCLALPVNRGVGVLLVPEVIDLEVEARERPFLTPTSARDCRVGGAGDAVLQARIRLRSLRATQGAGCYAMTFRPTAWASQQKSRVATLHAEPGDAERLRQFEVALHCLPPRLRQRQDEEGVHGFWADSVVRPLVADNLARGRPWYEDFTRLMHARDEQNRPLRDRVRYELEGLHQMSDEITPAESPEALLVRAVHEAIRNNLGRIREETDKGGGPPSAATKNRWNRFRERLRLALVGAKTADQCRTALCTLFGNAGQLAELQEGWRALLPLLGDRRWQQARDLALFALASYRGSREGSTEENDTPTTEESA